jgi:hypothetical protein
MRICCLIAIRLWFDYLSRDCRVGVLLGNDFDVQVR